MDKTHRIPKPDDDDKINEGIDLFYKLMNKNKQIESSLWVIVCVFVLCNVYSNCGFTYHEFLAEISKAFEHYRQIFDRNKEDIHNKKQESDQSFDVGYDG